MYYKNVETGILGVLEIEIFFPANHGGQTFRNFFSKFFPWILQFAVAIYLTFLKINKLKFSKLLLPPLPGLPGILKNL